MFVRYEKTEDDETYALEGWENADGSFFALIDFNEFEKDPSRIPAGYQKVEVESWWVLKYKYDADKKPLEKDNEHYRHIKEQHAGEQMHFTHDNGGRPYLVYLSKERISVYREVQDKFYVRQRDREHNANDAWLYIEQVAAWKNYIKVWIGESIKNNTTTFVGTDNAEFLGNCILVKIAPSRYVFIGENVYEFSSDEELTIFYAPVGNNDVPYSHAIGEKYVYFMREALRVPISAFKTFTEEVQRNAYDAFYEDDLENQGLPFQDVREIQKRLY